MHPDPAATVTDGCDRGGPSILSMSYYSARPKLEQQPAVGHGRGGRHESGQLSPAQLTSAVVRIALLSGRPAPRSILAHMISLPRDCDTHARAPTIIMANGLVRLGASVAGLGLLVSLSRSAPSDLSYLLGSVTVVPSTFTYIG